MRAPAALAAVPLLVGSATALILWPRLPPDVVVAGAGASTLALFAASAEDDPPSICACLLIGFLFAGLTLGAITAERVYRPSLLGWYEARRSGEPVILEGELREDAAVTMLGTTMTLGVDRAGSQSIRGGVRLSIAGTMAPAAAGEWRRGRRIRVAATLRRPTEYRSPGVPEMTRALARRGVCLVGTVKSASLVEPLQDASMLLEAAGAVRGWARRRLSVAVGPSSERSAAVTTAILIGDRSRLSIDDERRLQEAGTYHVIAISGGNIAVVTLLLLIAGRVLFQSHTAAAAVAIVALLFYAVITGPTPSVERAVTAAVIFLTARLADHRGPPLNALAVAAVIAVAGSPVAVLDPGFLLSFGATLGILVGALRVRQPRPRTRSARLRRGIQAIGRAALAILIATVCAELVLMPVAASLFGRLTFAGLLLNFVAIPLMTIVQVAGAAVLLVPDLWSALNRITVWLVDRAAAGLVESARLVDIAPWLARPVRPPWWPVLALYYAALVATLSRRLRGGAVPCTAAMAALILTAPGPLARDDVRPSSVQLRVVVLDVGQGDASLISLPANRSVLVDAGGGAPLAAVDNGDGPAFDVGARVVVPALRALEVSSLEALLLTHGDPDHILGAPAVLDQLRVRSMWEGVPVPRHVGLQRIRADASRAGSTWRTLQAGDRESFGAVEVRVLHPPPPDWERQRVRNEDSVVLELRLGLVSIVLAGDIGREGERAILSRLEPGRLTVLKAGHHGSATSSTPELLSAMQPAAVIFSAGRDNRFGHPHPSVIARFEAMGTAIFRTDQDGAVFVETDGTSVWVRGWTGRLALLTASELEIGRRRMGVGS